MTATTSLIAIEVEAFRNFAEKATLRLDSLAPGLHLVRGINLANARLGSNGSGKSTFFSDAVTWCLTGRTSAGLRTTDVRSWLTTKPPQVALTFRIGEEERIIQRGPRATDLTVDGAAVGQEEVDALIGVRPAALTQAVIWGQGHRLFFDLPPGEKMGLLADALGLERWDRRAQAASERARRLETAQNRLDGELRGLQLALDRAQEQQKAARTASDEWAAEYTIRLDRARQAAADALRAMEKAEERLGTADLGADQAGTGARDVRASADGVTSDLSTLRANQGRLRQAIKALTTEIENVDRRIQSFEEEGECPTCGQVVRARDAAEHAARLREERKGLVAKRAKSRKTLEAASESEEELEGLLTKLRAEIKELEAAEDARTADRLLLEQVAADTRAKRTATSNELTRVEAETNPHRDAAARARQAIQETKREILTAEEKLQKYDASIERARFWARGFRDIRLTIIDTALDDLRDTTAEVLEGLGLGEWEVDYATEKENKSGKVQRELTVTVRAPGSRVGVRWVVYSGGEGQRLRLAGALALGEVLLGHSGTRLDFRVLDEPTRGLSPSGVRDLTEVLAQYAEEAGIRIFYVDHSAEDGAAFASTITVEGAPGGATVRSR